MPKHMPPLGAVLMVVVIAAGMGGWETPASAKNAFVEVTGQTQCWDTSVNPQPIDCSGTGEDGDIQAGVPFPTKLATTSFTPVGNEADLIRWHEPHETPQMLPSGVTAAVQCAT